MVDYDERSELVLLAMIRTNNAEDVPWTRVHDEAQRLDISTPRTFPSDSPRALQALDTANEEGFILRSRQTGQRVKLKFPHYLEIHKVRMGFSLKYVRDWYLASPDGELSPRRYRDVPDELYEAVEKEWQRLDNIAKTARNDFYTLTEDCRSLDLKDVPNSKHKGWICKYLRLLRSGDTQGSAAVSDEFAKQRVKSAPDICDDMIADLPV